ncbi:hypothetical protein [Pseudomonas rhizoryzae]|nr:hypothetical protein [Pseudomonas rhizoryzae]
MAAIAEGLAFGLAIGALAAYRGLLGVPVSPTRASYFLQSPKK